MNIKSWMTESYNRIRTPSSMIYKEKGCFGLIIYWVLWIPRRIIIKYSGSFGYDRLSKYKEVKSMINGKRILILGSGPSSCDLKTIPEDVKIFTCHGSPKILENKKISRRVDLYYAMDKVLDSPQKNILKLLSIFKPRIFITNNTRLVKKHTEYKNHYDLLIQDNPFNRYYMDSSIHPIKLDKTKLEKNSTPYTSTGMRLLQYSLCFKAKEIYMIGVDLGVGGYFFKDSFVPTHKEMDQRFMKIISEKYKHVYSLSKNSPITKYIKYKEWK